MKVLVRGGSISAGIGIIDSYVEILKRNIAFCNIEFINKSEVNATTFDCIETFYSDIDLIKPDILMLHFGIDDAYFPVYRSEFKENLVQSIRLARIRFNPEIILLTSHPFDNQYDMDMINIYYRTIREVALDLKCHLLPIHTYWWGFLYENQKNIHDYIQTDCRYPNEKGHMLYADAIIPILTRIIKNLSEEKY